MRSVLFHIIMAVLTIGIYNSTRLGDSRRAYISDILTDQNVDVMCIQETWLPKRNLNELDDISDQYMSTGVSGMPDKDIIRGRPYGGTGILWKHSISHMVKPVKTGCDMLGSIKIVLVMTIIYY